MQAEARARMEGVPATPPAYPQMIANAETLRGTRVKLRGRVVSAQRAESGRDIVTFALCTTGDDCPARVETGGPILVGEGEWASVVATLAGTETYRTRSDAFLTVPRLEGALIVP